MFDKPGAPVILCIGDSHTFGVLVPEEESYPSQLQKLFDVRGISVNVINDGIPGQNSSELRQRLPGLLDDYNPLIVIILSSSNNDWNKRDVVLSDLEDGVLEPGIRTYCSRIYYGIIGSLRSVRLVTYTWNRYVRRLHVMERVKDRRGRTHFHTARNFKGGQWDSRQAISSRSQRDLTNMIDTVREHGSVPIIMNYVAQPFAPMTLGNEIIGNVARARSVIFIDNDARIRPLFWKNDGSFNRSERDRLFLDDPEETHLSGPGYALVAENIFNAIMENHLLTNQD